MCCSHWWYILSFCVVSSYKIEKNISMNTSIQCYMVANIIMVKKGLILQLPKCTLSLVFSSKYTFLDWTQVDIQRIFHRRIKNSPLALEFISKEKFFQIQKIFTLKYMKLYRFRQIKGAFHPENQAASVGDDKCYQLHHAIKTPNRCSQKNYSIR